MGPSARSWISFTDQAADRRGRFLPVYLPRPHEYSGPVSPTGDTYRCHRLPYRAHNGLQAPLLKDADSLIPSRGVTFRKSQGAKFGSGCDAE